MNQETRIQKIQEVLKQEIFGKQEIPWQEKLVSMNAYKIPLKCLVYNKYNGRILSRTESLERQKYKIDIESKEGMKIIEKLLWDSKPEANKNTQRSIQQYGQEKVGIITRDGIIIDGNRRAMILNKINKDYFKAVVLPVTLEENPIEIEKLETSFQMGEDKKLDYNPIEKYLKTKKLIKRGISIKKIGVWMGEKEARVVEYSEVVKIMDEYLDYLQYSGIYTQLDGREEQFIGLTKWLNNYYGAASQKPFDGYKDQDVDDLKQIAFDYVRIKCKNEDFRKIASGTQESHFFGNKDIWEDFKDFHFQHIEPIKDQEEEIDQDSENLMAHLNDRDNKFYKKTQDEEGESFMYENLSLRYQDIKYKQSANEAGKLANNANKALTTINQKDKSFSKPEVQDQIENVIQLATDMLIKNSPEKILSRVIGLLESVDINSSEHSEEMLKKISQINKLSFEMKKKVGG
jgi:hypothetical protein